MSVVSPAGHCGPLETCNPLSARLVTNNNTDSLGKLRCLTLLASLDSPWLLAGRHLEVTVVTAPPRATDT